VESAHRLLGWLVGGAALIAALLALAGWARPPLRRQWLDRAILATIVLVAIDVLVGLALLVTGARPVDPLHFLYAVLALAALPVARFWGGRRRGPRAGLILLGAVVLVGLIVRLYQTGGHALQPR
jgi:heme A synthase